jgi:hypothetical protein
MERWILLDDFFGGSAVGKGGNDRIECDARVPDTHDPLGIYGKRNDLGSG